MQRASDSGIREGIEVLKDQGLLVSCMRNIYKLLCDGDSVRTGMMPSGMGMQSGLMPMANGMQMQPGMAMGTPGIMGMPMQPHT